MVPYRQRLAGLCRARGNLCVGIDPHEQIVTSWGLTYDVAGLEKCARGLVEALGAHVAVFKPQSAFFEVFGAKGIRVLQAVLEDIRQAGALSILDVKRGDIGSTMGAYARAYLADDAALAADAITVSPYLGFESLRPALDLAHQSGRGIYVLARTSNPEGGQVQFATDDAGRSVAQLIVDAARAENQAAGDDAVGLVIGATHHDTGVDLTGFGGSILAPGIGAQGGRVDELSGIFGTAAAHVLPSSSRGVMSAGPDANSLLERLQATLHP